MTNPLITDRMMVKASIVIRQCTPLEPKHAHKLAEMILEEALSGWMPPWVEPLANRWSKIAREREARLDPCGCAYETCAEELRATALRAHQGANFVNHTPKKHQTPDGLELSPGGRGAQEAAVRQAISNIFGIKHIRMVLVDDNARLGANRRTHVRIDFAFWNRRRFKKLHAKMLAAVRDIIGPEGELSIDKYVPRPK